MTPDQFVELHKRVTRLKLEASAHFEGRDLQAIANFERLTYGKIVAAPCGREDEFMAEGKRTGKLWMAVVKWNVKHSVYYTYNPTDLKGEYREEQGACFIGNDPSEMLERILDYVTNVENIIVGGPEDPRNTAGLSTYPPT